MDWLQQLSDEERAGLFGHSASRDHARGATIFTPSSEPHSVYLLEKGLVRIYRLSGDGEETTFGYVAPGEVFGELAAFGDFARESFAVAVRASRVWRIPLGRFQNLMERRPGVVLRLTRQIGQRMKRIESRVENLVFRDVRTRLAHILVELVEDFGRERGDERVLDLDLTQSELATLVGSTRQTVNVSLGELEDQGLIRREGRRLVVVKPSELQQAARARL